MSGKRKLETTISAVHEEKKPRDSQSVIDHSSGATSTNTMATPTSVQKSPQPLLDTTNSPQGATTPKRIKVTPLQPGQPIPSVPQTSTPALPVIPLHPQQNATSSPVTAPPSVVTPGTAPEGGQMQQTPTLMALSHCIKPVLLHA